MSNSPIDVLGIGNALVDVLAPVDEAFITKNNLARGAMSLIDEARAVELYDVMPSAVESSGGSAGNTIAGLASFGGKGAFIGKVADDQLGSVFSHDLKSMGVVFETAPMSMSAKTGRCLVMVTPDGERTMNTYLGAGVHLSPVDVEASADLIKRSSIIYLEGYLFDPEHAKQAFRTASDIARQAGRKVALSLSDGFCVERHRDDFKALVEQKIDLLFANESEITALWQSSSFDDAVQATMKKCKLAAITRSAQGSIIIADGKITTITAAPVAKVVDTTGAGDQYAAGVLYGLSRGMSMEQCGKLASLAAAEVISHMGPRPAIEYAEFIKKAA
jgi:sugar/nucleoside kinase (ribokinase family)